MSIGENWQIYYVGVLWPVMSRMPPFFIEALRMAFYAGASVGFNEALDTGPDVDAYYEKLESIFAEFDAHSQGILDRAQELTAEIEADQPATTTKAN